MRETPGSFVVLTIHRVWKIRKADRRGPHDDRSTLAGRLSACRDEIRANVALAPRVYLGVRALVGVAGAIALGPDGESPAAVEYAVEMMAFEPKWTLAAMLDEGRVGPAELDAVANAVAAFHATAPPAEQSTTSTDNALADHAPELDARRAAGLVRDAHGDLRADHVLLTVPVRLVGRPPVREERRMDVAYDVATLMADVARHGSAWGAYALLDAYAGAGGPAASRPLMRTLSQCSVV